ncbi:MAG TPA: hypothetical protein VH062_14305 [Polyangiaceae bacterium]|jgi:hypothetical protein|nr:hypothetical protein [Polyangiaceae bacterium]
MQPFPLVSIETRRHVPADPKMTRIGVGEARIDHAAGLPLRARRSAPMVMPTADWDEQARVHDGRQLRARMYGTDAPVSLPLKSRSTAFMVAAALLVAFIAVGVSIFFTGISATTLMTQNAPAKEAIPTDQQAQPVAPVTTNVPSDNPAPGAVLTVKTAAADDKAPPRSRSEFVGQH